ncbi:MFS transporter [Candidatus Symbiopectobacterium sp. NZEC135]|uniref:MFS transporter n=1 Tax=Candidatus Symbiopectobacterium sp. NZEC135 TaxID=2820471 RepID=UPI0022268736|nr:MFS transporter [Candidatus Symbiopectobacterium sp. NZEC135]MCW2479901.1 MFS transporter [Candidatus Symbiopectobacterium sp. NZEC135]
MQRKLTLTLATSLMMFPQVVETIYSPALTHIADGFHVSAEIAAQTLSSYFFAFALGVVVWGRLCDVIGRRPVILLGLGIYLFASVIAVLSDTFAILLGARVMAAFGAAVGSVGTQTAIRDCFNGQELAQVFSLMGIAMAIGPAVGVLSGTVLTHYWGFQGVFTGLTVLAALLLGYAAWQLPETRPRQKVKNLFISTFKRMLKDSDIWRSAVLVALLNICMFGYYQLAPFHFEALAIPQSWFGYTGLVLAIGVGIGAVVNKILVARNWMFISLLILACGLGLLGGIVMWVIENTLWFVLAMIPVVMAYGIAIPNILARALRRYKDCVGTAGAILGLMYYMMLGGGLVLAGLTQRLSAVLIISTLLMGIMALSIAREERRSNTASVQDI